MTTAKCKICRRSHDYEDEAKCLGNRLLAAYAERDLLRIKVAMMEPVVKAALGHKEPPFICTTMRDAVRDYRKATSCCDKAKRVHGKQTRT